MVTADQVKEIVREILQNRFPKIDVVAINVQERVNEDDDQLIEIEVVFDARGRNFDPADLRTLPREIIPKLEEGDHHGFPVISFVKNSERKGHRA